MYTVSQNKKKTRSLFVITLVNQFYLEGAHESVYLRQALSFNAEKFRESDLGHAPFLKNFWVSCPDCPWEHLCQIRSP